jgi:uncharacterized membrane protein YbaN (DUF454 family)
MTQALYFFLGWLFFALGAIGAVLPVMPTTVFMLMSLWAFSKSSQRFHDWLYNHRIFGPSLQQWKQNHIIPLKAKVTAIFFMSCSMTYLLAYSSAPTWAIASAAVLMLYAAIFILTKPSHPPNDVDTTVANS